MPPCGRRWPNSTASFTRGLGADTAGSSCSGAGQQVTTAPIVMRMWQWWMHEHITDRWALTRAIIQETYPILLETGLYIQAWPLAEAELENPDESSNPTLLRNVVRQGITL
jgi:hypothetical protein